MTVTFDARNHYWLVRENPQAVFSSAIGAFIPVDDERYVAWLQEPENELTYVTTQNELSETLRLYNVPPYHRVAKSTIIARLTDVELAAANEAFSDPANLRLRERWYAPDQPAVNANDPESISFVQAIGANPEVVLAPE
jgi:hypothetical protein